MPLNQKSGTMSGQEFNKFKIIRELGRGGMGIVYLAEDTTLQRKIALKILRDLGDSDPGFRERAIQEARASAAFHHPHIVRVNSFHELDGQIAIEMEYAEAGSVADLMILGPIDPCKVALLAHHVLQALARCHSEGIIHRDIKPSNILLDRDGRALLSDFGLAKILAYSQQMAMVSTASSVVFVGTPRYAAPEAWDGHDPTPAWDIYSLGMVLYEALTGRPPYEALTPLALAKAIASRPVPPVSQLCPDISGEFSEFIQTMIAREPENRESSATVLLKKLAEVPEAQAHLMTSPTILPRSSARSTFAKFTRRVQHFLSTLPAQRAFISGILLAIVFIATPLWYFAPNRSPIGTNDASDASSTNTQSGYLQSAVPNLSSLLTLRRSVDEVPPRPFSYRITQTQANFTPGCLLFTNPGSQDFESVWLGARSIWYVRAQQVDNQQLSFTGEWAEYQDEGARLLRRGQIRGTGYWISSNTAFSAALDFECNDDGARWSWSVNASECAPTETDTKFVYHLEENAYIQSLVFHELIPRRVPWLDRVESCFPTILGSTCLIPAIAPGTNPIVIDGQALESAWTDRIYTDAGLIGTLSGYPSNQPISLRTRYDEKGVYFCITAPSAYRATSIRFELMEQIAFPVGNSPRRVATFHPAKEPELHYYVRNTESPWGDSGWQIAENRDKDGFCAEIFVPIHSELRATVLEERWRVSVIAAKESRSEPTHTLGFIGFPVPDKPYHGALLRFADPSEQRTGAPVPIASAN